VNLVENALKYSPAGTPLRVAALEEDGFVSLTVSDRGPGIPSGEEERIFEKFYRAVRGGGPGGVGLGLAICRAIVRAHGGRIRAENRAGGGAVFRFTLPSSPPPPLPPEAP
jgi:two-component system sensor histidine kinase KdpD